MGEPNIKQFYKGMNLDSSISQKGDAVSYALNAVVENFAEGQINYQNEQANEFCTNFPSGYQVIGRLAIIEESFILVWLANPTTGDSEIGKIKDCTYTKIINGVCLNFSVEYPILKAVYRKTECNFEVYWAEKSNSRRYLDLMNLPFKTIKQDGICDELVTDEIDCNKLSVQPNFSIPELLATEVDIAGEIREGTVQFAIQYANANSEPYTSFYSVTNPLSIADSTTITADFNLVTSKSVRVSVTNIDTTGYYDYFNLAVIQTVNNITSVYLVGTYQITTASQNILFSGQKVKDLSIDEVFEKYPIYDRAGDITTAQDVLIWDDLESVERLSYQSIANKIHPQWITYRQKGNNFYKDGLNTANKKGYMRDETYPLELCLLLTNGHQTDGFHIAGRQSISTDLDYIFNDDTPAEVPLPRWKVYNTASVGGFEQDYINATDPATYEGPYQYGDFAYSESEELYPCNPIWGELADQKIRHHRFPDNLVSNFYDDQGYIYPIGIKINHYEIVDAIQNSNLTRAQKDAIVGYKIVRGNRAGNETVVAKGLIHNVGKYTKQNKTYLFPNYPYNDLRKDPFISSEQTTDDSGSNLDKQLDAFSSEDSKNRFTFHSPDTHFYQPSLGNVLKLESVAFGTSEGHFVEVKNHSQYQFLSSGAYGAALASAIIVGLASFTIGTSNNVFNGTAAFTAYTILIETIQKTTPYKNFVFQANSIGNYSKFKNVDNSGNKQRLIDISQYIIPGYQNVTDTFDINNFQRESSVYLKAKKKLIFPSDIGGVPQDRSRWVLSNYNCEDSYQTNPISSYYAAIKKIRNNQYGQIYSYQTIDTGAQVLVSDVNQYKHVFGGDTFINKFAYKSKLPFFIDNRVSTNAQTFPNQADINYPDFNNVGFPTYWMSTDINNDSIDSSGIARVFKVLFGVALNNFDCVPSGGNPFYQQGKMYLQNYGIPYFWCESSVNTDLRQAYNSKEGEFFPHISSGIPDDWLQETFVSIQNDNTYTYNKTFSKQNKENNFSHLPLDFTEDECRTRYPNRAIFSEPRTSIQNSGQRNNWLIYKPISFYDFPQNFGKLISLDGIENKQVLARFTSRTQLYNTLLTAPTSVGQVYLGQSLFSSQVPPIDYADTDMGYIGSQHKFLLKTEFGHITCDSERSGVFLLNGQQAKELSGEGMDTFFNEFFDFQIQKSFPSVNIDNNYNHIGLHGVYDAKYKRLILTKLDWKPKVSGITFLNNKFYYGEEVIDVTNTEYFENQCFTISYSFKIGAWVSFHTYIPNYYIGLFNYFYTGINGTTPSLWKHNTVFTKFNNFYGTIAPYIIELPFNYKFEDEIIQSILDYSKVYTYNDFFEQIETDDRYFNKAILSNSQQCSGILKLTKKPKNNLNAYGKYPVYNLDSKEILFTKSNNLYQFNTFWSLIKDPKQPIWVRSTINLSYFKDLNQSNMNYSKRSFNKGPIRGKDVRVRFILDDSDDIKVISNFLVTTQMTSFK